MLLVQYGYIFLVLIFLLLFSSPEGSENKETKISELGKYISYCTLSRAITITYIFRLQLIGILYMLDLLSKSRIVFTLN